MSRSPDLSLMQAEGLEGASMFFCARDVFFSVPDFVFLKHVLFVRTVEKHLIGGWEPFLFFQIYWEFHNIQLTNIFRGVEATNQNMVSFLLFSSPRKRLLGYASQ